MRKSQPHNQKFTTIPNNYVGGGVAIICPKSDKSLRHPNEWTSWKNCRSEKANSSPACHRERREYPPGYTVFECRLDGNQPIAQVVQVPPDTTGNIIGNETCMLLETKQSEFGPSSRVAAYPSQNSRKTSQNRPQPPMSFALESRDRPGGAVACVGKVARHVDDHSATSFPQRVTTLETTKHSTCRNGPSSRLVYGRIPETVVSSERYRTPALYIECTTTPEGPLARVTQVPQEFTNSSGDPGMYFETSVKNDGTSPTATVTHSNKMDVSGTRKTCEFLETKVDPSGPQARAMTRPEGLENFRYFTNLDACLKENGPVARISQHPGDLTKMIPQLKGNLQRSQSPQRPWCCDNEDHNVVTHCQSPPKMFSRLKDVTNEIAPHVTTRRNGLTPTPSELKTRIALINSSRCIKRKTGAAPKTCPAHCCLPVSCIMRESPVCKVQAHSPAKTSQTFGKQLESSVPWPKPCFCRKECRTKSPIPYCSRMHPLPGGSVFSTCPAPSLPEIAPVPLGPNRFRDYKPRPKSSGPRRTTATTTRRPKQTSKVDSKSKKPTKSVVKTTTKNKKKIKTTNKETSTSKEIIDAPGTREEDKKKDSTTASEETVYVECPAFASKAMQSIRVCVSKGNQAMPIDEEPYYVECPAFESKGNQTVLVRKEPTYVECPAFESKRNRSLPRVEEPTYVECPAFESKRNRSLPRVEEPTYVTCPALASGKSSETSTMYVPREDLLNAKYPEYCVRPKTLETCGAYRTKRNELQDQRDFSIYENMLRMSYEKRRNRYARTLVSNGRRREFEDKFNEEIPRAYCVRA